MRWVCAMVAGGQAKLNGSLHSSQLIAQSGNENEADLSSGALAIPSMSMKLNELVEVQDPHKSNSSIKF